MKYFTQEEITWDYQSLQRCGLITQEEARKTMDRIRAKIPYKPLAIMPSIAMSETNIHLFKKMFRATQQDKPQEKEALNSYENFTQSPQTLESCLPNTNPLQVKLKEAQNIESKSAKDSKMIERTEADQPKRRKIIVKIIES